MITGAIGSTSNWPQNLQLPGHGSNPDRNAITTASTLGGGQHVAESTLRIAHGDIPVPDDLPNAGGGVQLPHAASTIGRA
jgi:hypothetical protein